MKSWRQIRRTATGIHEILKKVRSQDFLSKHEIICCSGFKRKAIPSVMIPIGTASLFILIKPFLILIHILIGFANDCMNICTVLHPPVSDGSTAAAFRKAVTQSLQLLQKGSFDCKRMPAHPDSLTDTALFHPHPGASPA